MFQEFSSTAELTVAENIYLGFEPVSRFGFINYRQLRRAAEELLERYHLQVSADALVGSLSVADRQQVELARALSACARILILDEPTAVLSPHEWRNLQGIIRHMTNEGHLVLYVSHRLEEVFSIADRITVFRNGKAIANRRTSETSHQELVRLMTGRETRKIVASKPPPSKDAGPPLLRVSLRRGKACSQFQLRQGEIVGLAGLVGSGRTTLARAIIGAAPGLHADIEIDGREVKIDSPRQAYKSGIAYVTEDRKRDGLFPALSVTSNCSAATLPVYSPWGILNGRKEDSTCASILKQLGLVARSHEMSVADLSGGNQQKVVMAPVLLTKPRILICDEPTRGIDVGAKTEIYEILQKLAGQGVAILLISSEFSELLALAHRLLVVRDGAIRTELSCDASEEELLLAATTGDARQTTRADKEKLE